MEFIIRNEKTR